MKPRLSEHQKEQADTDAVCASSNLPLGFGGKHCKRTQNFHTSDSSWRVSKPSCFAREKHKTVPGVRAVTSLPLTVSPASISNAGEEKPKPNTAQAGAVCHLCSRAPAPRSARTISRTNPGAGAWTQVTFRKGRRGSLWMKLLGG